MDAMRLADMLWKMDDGTIMSCVRVTIARLSLSPSRTSSHAMHCVQCVHFGYADDTLRAVFFSLSLSSLFYQVRNEIVAE